MLNFVTNPAMQLCQFRDKAIDGQDKSNQGFLTEYQHKSFS